MATMHELVSAGVSIWLDYIRRSFIASGDLQQLIDAGLRGITSNPTILEKAIGGSSDYDQALAGQPTGRAPVEIYEELAIADIQAASDLFRPLYDATDGGDGFVSLEVSPYLANDTDKTVSEARRLWGALKRPNVMIKVPATPAGIPAIRQLIGEAININVTLMFGLQTYREVAEAYIAGLEARLHAGEPVDRIASVASVFISRIDGALDDQLEGRGLAHLQGMIAIANAQVTYAEFQRSFTGKRWDALRRAGATVQRPLWASMSTKSPSYLDTLYVDALVGPHTVSTLPPPTLAVVRDHGDATVTLGGDVTRYREQLREVTGAGIDLDGLMVQLRQEGVDKFAESFDRLLAAIEEKQVRLESKDPPRTASLGPLQTAVDRRLQAIQDQAVMSRIWNVDHTVWKQDPTEIRNRLGWLTVDEMMDDQVGQLQTFAAAVRGDGLTHVLLLGMGGSSLAPEVFQRVLGVAPGYLDLRVVDGTDPQALRQGEEWAPAEATLHLVSTKSGTTVETLSFLKHFYARTVAAVGPQHSGSRFVAITDPGSALATLAQQLQFRGCFLNDPNIGGRYSALSYVGLVPAALMGADLVGLLDRYAQAAHNSEGCNAAPEGDNAGAWLGAILGEAALAGRDKLTLVLSETLTALGGWLEQLVAESTGKESKGILPVEGERPEPAEELGPDRLVVYLRLAGEHTWDSAVDALEQAGHPVVRLVLRDPLDVAAQMFLWEMATAVAGHCLGINPFDQPNVESAKVRAREMVDGYAKTGRLPGLGDPIRDDVAELHAGGFKADSLRSAVDRLLEVPSGGYVAVQVYAAQDPALDEQLAQLRAALRRRTRAAVTLGYGPRFLHSTGQLHKGDSGKGVFLQLIARSSPDLPIPETTGDKESRFGFEVLKQAQALGDRKALIDAGRRVLSWYGGGNIGKEVARVVSLLG